ncbi:MULTISPECIES: cytosine deaminase [unclassified Roseitalea]|uniref:cytosine deaminase n=1 Tax=unclassified Roseitalea TaxID=2639107 RepID=UPI00273D959B|nr:MULTISPECIES: cytosine deaminase [unclassified Roseitalea]
MLHRARLHRSWLDAPSARHDADGFGLYDLEVIDRRVASITPAVANGAHVENDLRGRIVSPCFVDCHTHLDKGHIWHRRSNPDGTFAGALEAVAADRTANWTAEDVATRMQFGLKCAHAHGTRAIRTHIDSDGPQDAISWPVFERLRAEWSGRIELQGACLQSIEKFREPGRLDALADRVAGAGGVLGAVAYMVPDIDELLDAVFAAAMKRGLALDFHADETGEADARALHHIALAAIRHGYRDRILIGHCCSLARQPEAHVLETLDLVARSGIDVVTLPLCNLFLQDRRTGPTTPRWRGVTLVHEMAERGINVCAASDNTRDPFYAYGDLDMLEVYRMATRICHFDHPVGDWPRAVFANPARAMGLDPVHGRIAAGEPADLIIFAGRSWTELLSRPEPDRVVVREGTVIDRALPAYEELDHLME